MPVPSTIIGLMTRFGMDVVLAHPECYEIFEDLEKVALEKELPAQNAEHKDWACTEELMSTTKEGKSLYLHCLPADITGVSCEEGEVDATVFDRYRNPLCKEASYKPYIIAAIITLLEKSGEAIQGKTGTVFHA